MGPAGGWDSGQSQDIREVEKAWVRDELGDLPNLPHSPPQQGAQVRPLVKVLLPDIAAVQHKDIEDVDGTNLPLGLPLEGQVCCPFCLP